VQHFDKTLKSKSLSLRLWQYLKKTDISLFPSFLFLPYFPLIPLCFFFVKTFTDFSLHFLCRNLCLISHFFFLPPLFILHSHIPIFIQSFFFLFLFLFFTIFYFIYSLLLFLSFWLYFILFYSFFLSYFSAFILFFLSFGCLLISSLHLLDHGGHYFLWC
jgi:hypothetical protein